MKIRYIFDSHALLAFFQNENGAEVVYKILQKTRRNNKDPLICIINLGEILYMTKRRFGESKKVEILGRIHQLSFEVLPAPDQLVFRAAEIKAEHPISYAECFVVACAQEHSAVIVTGDPDFKPVEHLAKITWLR